MLQRLLIAAFACACSAHAVAQDGAAALTAGGGFGAAAIADCKTDLSYLNQVTGWQATWPNEWDRLRAAPRDMKNDAAALARWKTAPDALARDTEALRASLSSGRTAPRAVALRILQQASDLRRALEAEDAPTAPGAFGVQWRALETGTIAPAIARYEDFLRDDYIPHLSDGSALARLDDGGACFANAARTWTGLALSNAEIEAIGARYIKDARAALKSTAPKNESARATLARLRNTPATAPIDGPALIALSSSALARAQAAIGAAFSLDSVGEIIVAPMAAHMQDSFPAGYYQPAEGGAPAAYVINPSRPAERRLLAEAVAFHEGIPGHHLFFAYPRDKDRGAFNAGLLEGWAIYAEQLADEMGLYGTALDREGLYAKRLWAASRLIIEPRLHSGAWSRTQAIDFMRRTTALPEAEIEIEIDRYLAMPGQSLSYMLGADVILSARAKAKAELGEAFDIREFHDAVVGPGSRTLPEVIADVDAMIAARR